MNEETNDNDKQNGYREEIEEIVFEEQKSRRKKKKKKKKKGMDDTTNEQKVEHADTVEDDEEVPVWADALMRKLGDLEAKYKEKSVVNK